MIAEEQQNKTMKLTKGQASQMLRERMTLRLHAAEHMGDHDMAIEWKRSLANIEKKATKERIETEFITDFISWLQGRSTWNATEFDKVVS